MSYHNILRRLGQLSWEERSLLVETLVCLTIARSLVLALPFPYLAKRLGEHMAESGSADHIARQPFLTNLTWALGALSRRLPWRCLCLEQALAAQMVLRRRGMAHTLYLGARLSQGKMEAHAWVRCGRRLVTGDNGQDFPVVSCFAERGSQS
jgi:hypothetical protein